jgi:hypothetical protein
MPPLRPQNPGRSGLPRRRMSYRRNMQHQGPQQDGYTRYLPPFLFSTGSGGVAGQQWLFHKNHLHTRPGSVPRKSPRANPDHSDAGFRHDIGNIRAGRKRPYQPGRRSFQARSAPAYDIVRHSPCIFQDLHQRLSCIPVHRNNIFYPDSHSRTWPTFHPPSSYRPDRLPPAFTSGM